MLLIPVLLSYIALSHRHEFQNYCHKGCLSKKEISHNQDSSFTNVGSLSCGTGYILITDLFPVIWVCFCISIGFSCLYSILPYVFYGRVTKLRQLLRRELCPNSSLSFMRARFTEFRPLQLWPIVAILWHLNTSVRFFSMKERR